MHWTAGKINTIEGIDFLSFFLITIIQNFVQAERTAKYSKALINFTSVTF